MNYQNNAEVIKKFLEYLGIKDLYPPQKMAWQHLYKKRSLVVSAPTASGKTLIAYITALNAVINGKKCVYSVPLRALAMEKYRELRSIMKEFMAFVKENDIEVGGGGRVAVSVGDYDSAEEGLGNYDVVICTSEKLDSILRHMPSWISEISVLVVDEVHTIGDMSRGPTLEMVITRLRETVKDIQIIALSATITNAEELAEWLDATLIQSEWRPVELRKGVCIGDHVIFSDGVERHITEVTEKVKIKSDNMRSVAFLLLDAISHHGQMLVFVSTRRYAEIYAEQLGRLVEPMLSTRETKRLQSLSEKVSKVGVESDFASDNYTKMVAQCIRRGVCFHHAGLTNELRGVIEDAFLKGYLKCIVATPTLAAGVNLPARRVVVAHYTRYEPGLGQVPLRTMEVQQMLGRAGRPKYDKYGEGIIVSRSYGEMNNIMETYIFGHSEEITSNLSADAAMRTHTLALVCWYPHGNDFKGLLEIMKGTFYAHQHGLEEIKRKMEDTLAFLEFEGFIYRDQSIYKPTSLGHVVSRLYIDPLTASRMGIALEIISKDSTAELRSIPYLFAISGATELHPLPTKEQDFVRYVNFLNNDDFATICAIANGFYLQNRVWSDLEDMKKREYVIKQRDEIRDIIVHESIDNANDYYAFERSFFFVNMLKSAMVYASWIDEWEVDAIHKEYNLAPGDLRSRVEMGEWLLYSKKNIADIMEYSELISNLENLVERMHYGVKAESLELVRLKGIGRKRAKLLFSYGIRNISAVKAAGIHGLTKIKGIGYTLARNILNQLGVEVNNGHMNKEKNAMHPRTTIDEF